MIQPILIHNAQIYSPTGLFQPGWLLIEGRAIGTLAAGIPPDTLLTTRIKQINAYGKHLLPGFIDLHIHGALGHDVMDASNDGLREIAAFLPRHGVTSFLAATWTAAEEDIFRVIQTISDVYGSNPGSASLLGAYLEGPFLNPNRAGSHAAELIRSPSNRELISQLLDTEMVRMLVLAPENPENLWLMDECARRGIAVSAGHTAATYEEMQVAVQHGVRHVTHCFNAMGVMHHRNPGVIGAALTMPEIRCELIADNIHVHPAVQKILYQAKGPYGMMLVSDSIRVTGMPDGEYSLDSRMVTMELGSAHLADGTLAGSCTPLDQGLRNFYNNIRRPLTEIWPVVTLTAARAAGIAHQKGVLEVGHDADLVLLDDDLQVVLTIVEGKIAYQA
ncbi:MAG: N-acetylglucosamine-6-phosphate deacetylase [Bellilinea sp.]